MSNFASWLVEKHSKSDTPVGSRLPAKKVCMRKSVMDEQRRQDRELTEAVQRSGGGPFQSRDR